MKCPACGAKDTRVLDSRPFEDNASIKRRRECPNCSRRFTTYEMVEALPLVVIKKDGIRREPFDRLKLQSGIVRACHRRPVDAEAVAADIENELINSLVGEVSSTQLGEMVLERLKTIDEVSYVRFASVYREFRDVDSFMAELKTLVKKKGKKKAQ